MSNRNQTLILVEGELEKDKMMKTLLKCFPKIPIKLENIHIYHTNIYNLYNDIEEEYGHNWFEEELSIDLPWLISKRAKDGLVIKKKNFTNIILMFDYEHQDSFYSDEKIVKLQKHFSHIEDDGILYINYPMVEALYHYNYLLGEDGHYLEKEVPVKGLKGSVYKPMVRNESDFMEYANLFVELVKNINEKWKLSSGVAEEAASSLLSVNKKEEIEQKVCEYLSSSNISDKKKNNIKFSCSRKLEEKVYFKKGISFFDDIGNIFKIVAIDNIKKAIYIQTGQINEDITKELFNEIQWDIVLKKQNELSYDAEKGRILVLCSSITFLAEYKFFWE